MGSAVTVRACEFLSSIYRSSSECAWADKGWNDCTCTHGSGSQLQVDTRQEGPRSAVCDYSAVGGTHSVVGTRGIQRPDMAVGRHV